MVSDAPISPNHCNWKAFWQSCLTWGLALLVLLLTGWGAMRYWHGWNLRQAARTRHFGLRVESSTTPALRAWFGEEFLRPLDRVVGVGATDPASDLLALMNGLPYLRSLSLGANAPQSLPDLGVLDWEGMARLETLRLRSPRLDLSTVRFESLGGLKELFLTSAEFTGTERLKLPATLQSVHVCGQLAPELLAAISQLPDLENLSLFPTLDEPLPAGWAGALHTLRARTLHLEADPSPVRPQQLARAIPADQIPWGDLARLDGVKSLHLTLVELGAEELSQLAEHSQLQSLRLSFIDWRPGPSKPLTGFPRLETLSLVSSHHGFSLELLAKLPVLRRLTLSLSATVLDRERLGPLSRLRSLETLEITSLIDQTGLQALTEFPTLKELDLSNYNVNSTILAEIATLQSLTLHINGTSNVREQLLPLARLPALKKLRIGPHFDPSGIPMLASFPALEELSLEGPQITLSSLEPLAESATLKRLEIRDNPAARSMTAEWQETRLPAVEVISKLGLVR